jgi:hypothetical protein
MPVLLRGSVDETPDPDRQCLRPTPCARGRTGSRAGAEPAAS